MLVRTRSEYACVKYCLDSLCRTERDGAQVLYEINAPGASNATTARMRPTRGWRCRSSRTPRRRPSTSSSSTAGSSASTAAWIDAPLAVVRLEYTDEPQHGLITPHAN